jgi:hypothetical protein
MGGNICAANGATVDDQGVSISCEAWRRRRSSDSLQATGRHALRCERYDYAQHDRHARSSVALQWKLLNRYESDEWPSSAASPSGPGQRQEGESSSCPQKTYKKSKAGKR